MVEYTGIICDIIISAIKCIFKHACLLLCEAESDLGLPAHQREAWPGSHGAAQHGQVTDESSHTAGTSQHWPLEQTGYFHVSLPLSLCDMVFSTYINVSIVI